MEKIPTLFERDWEGNRKVINKSLIDLDTYNVIATEKIDGTNVRVTVRNGTSVRLEKRRNPDKIQKAKGITEPWYVEADPYDKGDKWIFDALDNTDLSNVPDGEWSAEAVGTNIQGNPLNLTCNRLFFFSLPEVQKQLEFDDAPTDFEGLKEWLPKQKSKVGIDAPIEGIVWHSIYLECADMPLAKIKTKDFSN